MNWWTGGLDDMVRQTGDVFVMVSRSIHKADVEDECQEGRTRNGHGSIDFDLSMTTLMQ